MREWVRFVLSAVLATCLHASTWIAVTSPRFEVLTDAGERAARQLVVDLQQFDGAVAHSAMGSFSGGGTQRVYLFHSEQEFSEFRNEPGVTGLTLLPGNKAAPVILTFAGSQTRKVAIHEYVHALVGRGDWKLPRWFEEGLSELYGHSERTGRDRISVGQAIPEYLAILKNGGLRPSIYFGAGSKPDFYAASWAMVHMLLMDPRYRSLTEQLLTEGGGWDRELPGLVRDLWSCLEQERWKESAVYAPMTASGDTAVRILNPLDAEFMLANLLVDARRPVEARRAFKKIASAHPNDAAGPEALALAALADGEPELARRELRRAVDRNSIRAQVWFELAALDREANVAWVQVKPLLVRAAILDPGDYQPAFLLGVRDSDEGQNQQAVAYLAKAAAAAPGRPEVWHAYALALRQAGRMADARVAAKRALRVASSPEWGKMAAELVSSLELPPVAGEPGFRRKPEVVTSSAWSSPVPDATAEGRFVEFDCEADPPRLRVEMAGGKVVDLFVRDPRQVNILTTPSGESTIELKCGPQNSGPIRVGYRRSDSTVLEVKSLQVHDSKRF